MNTLERLKAAAVATKTATESLTLELVGELAEMAAERPKLKQQMGDLDARVRGIDEQLKPIAEEYRRERSQADGKPYSSVQLGECRYTTENRYAAIPATCETDLRQKFGEKFETYFRPACAVVIDGQKLPEEILTALLNLGAKVKFAWKPTDVLHSAIACDAMVAKQAADTGVIQPVAYIREI